jgi:hypothetical protein
MAVGNPLSGALPPQIDWSVDLSSSFNHPRVYMLLKTNEEIVEAGLAVH